MERTTETRGVQPSWRLGGAMALEPADQRRLARMLGLHGYHRLAIGMLRTSVASLRKLEFGGKAQPDLVGRVSAGLRRVCP